MGTSTGRPDRPPVELELRNPEGQPVDVGDLRGEPVLLYLFATFDGVSQAGVQPLERTIRNRPSLTVLAIAVQPGAGPLVDAWTAALDPSFPVTWEPAGTIARGTSDLGEVETVPTYILLDRRGMETARHVGFASQRDLDQLLANLDD